MALWYKGKNHAADIVLLAGEGSDRSIALIERKESPFKGSYAFPGGFVDTSAKPGEEFTLDVETPKDAALRELKEEATVDLSQVKNLNIQFIGLYSDIARDPRNTETSQVASHAFLVQIPKEVPLKAQDDAAKAEWVLLEDIVKGRKKLAFDHGKILNDGLKIALSKAIFDIRR